LIGFVLCAGLGTRFRPATLTVPKPLLPFLGRPMVFHVLDRLLEAGVDRLVVNSHHLADALEAGIGTSYRGVPVSFSREEEILGTAGAIRRAAERGLLGNGRDRYLVANGDIFTTLPLGRLAAEGEKAEAKAGQPVLSILAVIPNERPGVDTPLWADREGRLVGVGGDRPDPGATGPWLFTGLQSVSPRLAGLVPSGPSELARDLLRPSAERRDGAFRLLPFAVPEDGLWFDLGTPERRADAESVARARALARPAVTSSSPTSR
jgi:NDP-sugar pyrophosphorylase family protein